jgi:hypothetical protein
MKSTTPAQLLQQIAQIQAMEPGKLCVLRQGPAGPYYNLQWRENGQAVTRYVPGDQAETVRQHTANYQQFQALVDQYAQHLVAATRANRAEGVKKKPWPRPSPSPKTTKSKR